MNKSNVKAFSDLLDSLVLPAGFKGDDPVKTKADLLDRSIESWRISTGHTKNGVSFEEFYHSRIFVDGDAIHIVAPSSYPTSDKGTRPILLQPSLIIFLLLRHRERYKVYDIIESYVKSKCNELTELDFKKTDTGVTRCFTNTRFAANVLRAYGFLKYTHTEAYKTWVLSLSGFIVASVALQERMYVLESKLPHSDRELHPIIKSAWESVDTFEKFVAVLTYLCKPDVDIFRTFGGVLTAAYALLDPYWQVLRNEERKRIDRRRESLSFIKRLEALPGIEDFYRELSDAMNIEMFMKAIGLTKASGQTNV